MRVIGINGAHSSGKTTFALKLEEELRLLQPSISVIQGHFKDPLVALVGAFYQQATSEPLPKFTEEDYRKFKKQAIFGKTGRDWMVAISQGIKSIDPIILVRMLVNRYDFKRDDVLIVDDVGTTPEYNGLLHTPFVTEFHMVYMEQRGDRLYSHGENFGDERVSLRGYAGSIDPDPTDYAKKFLNMPIPQEVKTSASD